MSEISKAALPPKEEHLYLSTVLPVATNYTL